MTPVQPVEELARAFALAYQEYERAKSKQNSAEIDVARARSEVNDAKAKLTEAKAALDAATKVPT